MLEAAYICLYMFQLNAMLYISSSARMSRLNDIYTNDILRV